MNSSCSSLPRFVKLLRALVAGLMFQVAFPWSGIGQHTSDGFNPAVDGPVHAIALQADGSMIIGGDFTTVAGEPSTNLARLDADGNVDTTFNSGANDVVSCVVVQSDGKILVGGSFTNLAGQARSRIGRLNSKAVSTTRSIPERMARFTIWPRSRTTKFSWPGFSTR